MPTATDITIDGSEGEGGGQILRSSLALSLITGRSFRLVKVRAKRKRPGLLRQHLTCVEAAAAISEARTEGAVLGSPELAFWPGEVRPGEYAFAVGTAGSSTLVFQSILPALIQASGPTMLTLEGGTHNPLAPPFEFLDRSFLPVLARMGVRVELALERPGFYPAGGGRWHAVVQPTPKLVPLEIAERGESLHTRAYAMVAHLPASIARRELAAIRKKLDIDIANCHAIEETRSVGPGNVVTIEMASEHVTEIVTAWGEFGRPAESVASECANGARNYLRSQAPVGIHLADQLILPFALAGSGSFVTSRPTLHTRTSIDIVGRFLEAAIRIEELEGRRVRIVFGDAR